ncbi:MAG: radical SAM protein [Pseudomonadales bacterium]|nr:radical SAM protein [Pseudomonadales bacterium]
MADYSLRFKKTFVDYARDDSLFLTILPTEKCNFRCVYCYEDFLIPAMRRSVLKGIKNLLSNSAPHLKKLSISWFGGEPTLNSPAALNIMEEAQCLKKRYGFSLSSNMTTNSYLLDQDLFRQFVKLGITSYQVSLDGNERAHNTTRVLANGGGTFDRIWANLRSFKAVEDSFQVTLRLHITKFNSESMLELCYRIKEELWDDTRFSTYIRQISNLGAGISGQVKNYLPEKDEVAESISKMKQILSRTSSSLGSDRVTDIASFINDKTDHHICYAAAPRAFVIRANGRIAKCTVAFNSPSNDLGYLDPDGSLIIDDVKQDIWSRGFATLHADSLICPAKNFPKLEPREAKNLIPVVQVA